MIHYRKAIIVVLLGLLPLTLFADPKPNLDGDWEMWLLYKGKEVPTGFSLNIVQGTASLDAKYGRVDPDNELAIKTDDEYFRVARRGDIYTGEVKVRKREKTEDGKIDKNKKPKTIRTKVQLRYVEKHGYLAMRYKYQDRMVVFRLKRPPRIKSLRVLAQHGSEWEPAFGAVINHPLMLELELEHGNTHESLPLKLHAGGERIELMAKAVDGNPKRLRTDPICVTFDGGFGSLAEQELPDAGDEEEDPWKPTDGTLTGTWRVLYKDKALGFVTGIAQARENKVELTLYDPKTNRSYTLNSTKVEWHKRSVDAPAGDAGAGDTKPKTEKRVTIELEGQSPSAPPVKKPDLSAFPKVVIGADAKGLAVLAQTARIRFPILRTETADHDKVTVLLTEQDEGRFSGMWHYKADPLTCRDLMGGGRSGILRQGFRDRKLFARLMNVEQWLPQPPVLENVVVVTDQLGRDRAGEIKRSVEGECTKCISPRYALVHEKPKRKKDKNRAYHAFSPRKGPDKRRIVIIGRDLPMERGHVRELESLLPKQIKRYRILEFGTKEKLNGIYKEEFKEAVKIHLAQVKAARDASPRGRLGRRISQIIRRAGENPSQPESKRGRGGLLAGAVSRALRRKREQQEREMREIKERIRKTTKQTMILLEVEFVRGTPPGRYSFKLNGTKGDWALAYGDGIGAIRIARVLAPAVEDNEIDETEATSNLFVPETFILEIKAAANIPHDSLDLVLLRNGKEVPLGNPFTAKKVSERPCIYHTGKIQLTSAPRDGEAVKLTKGVIYAKPEDVLEVVMKDPQKLLIPDPCRAEVHLTPAKLGNLWKDALVRAAELNGKPFKDPNKISLQEAEEISNWSFSNMFLNSNIAFHVISSHIEAARSYARKFNLSIPSIRRTASSRENIKSIRVFIGDHAAMLLLRKAFVEMMARQLTAWAKVSKRENRDKMIVSQRRAMESRETPLGNVRVKDPQGELVPLWELLLDDWSKKKYKLNDWQLRRLQRNAMHTALLEYRRALRDSYLHAKEISESDVRELMRLTGHGFGPVVDELLPTLMKLEKDDATGKEQWVPDRMARAHVKSLGILAAAVQAQEDESKMDTTLAIAVASVVAFPLMSAGGVYTLAAIAIDVGDVVYTLATSIPEYVESRERADLALGRTGVLGMDQYQEALSRRKENWELALDLGGAAFAGTGAAFDGVRALRKAGEVVPATVRSGEELIGALQKDGFKATKNMSMAELAKLSRFATDAKKLLRAKGAGALTEAQLRAVKNKDLIMRSIGQRVEEMRAAERALDEMRGPTGHPRGTPKLEQLEDAADSLARKANATDDQLRRANDYVGGPNPKLEAKLKDKAGDIETRRMLLREMMDKAEKTPGSVRVAQPDVDLLSGKRVRLNDADYDQVRKALYNPGLGRGDWQRLTKKLAKGTPEDRLLLHKATVYRREQVNKLLDEVIADVEKQTGTKLKREALGSTSLTSDYDISVKGDGAELVVGEFNRRFRNKFGGKESGTTFDTNVYTTPIYDMFRIDPLSRGPIKGISNVDLDDLHQTVYRQMANRRYVNPEQWAKHRELMVKAQKPELREAMGRVMDEVESFERQAADQVTERLDALRKKGVKVDDDVRLAVRNDIYAETLEEIHGLRRLSSDLESLKKTGRNLDGFELPEELIGTKFGNDYLRAQRQLADIKTVEEGVATLERLQNLVNTRMRKKQGLALGYASEAYQSSGAYNHVVSDLQATKRKITTKSLMEPPPAKPTLSKDAYVSSFMENKANMYKELNAADLMSGSKLKEGLDLAKQEKAAAKVAKYFLRQLDAARQAGVDLGKMLPKELQSVIDQTVVLNKVRSDPAKLSRALKKLEVSPDKFVEQALKTADELTVMTAKQSNFSRYGEVLGDHYRALDARTAKLDLTERPSLLSPKPPRGSPVAKIGDQFESTYRTALDKLRARKVQGFPLSSAEEASLTRLSAAERTQLDLEQAAAAARAMGADDAAVHKALGRVETYAGNPLASRQAARSRMHELMVEQAGGKVMTDQWAKQIRDLAERVCKKTATAADEKALRDWIGASNARRESFFDELKRSSVIDGNRGARPAVADDDINALFNFAADRRLAPDTDMPTLRNGAVVTKPFKSKGTPVQLEAETCGLNVVEGMKGDYGLRKAPSETALRKTAIDKKLLEPGEGMTSNQMVDWIKDQGGWAQAKNHMSLQEMYQRISRGEAVTTMIRTGGGSYHWVRVEGIYRDTLGRLIVSVGDPASGKSWRQFAHLFEAQTGGQQWTVVADFRRKESGDIKPLSASARSPVAGTPMPGGGTVPPPGWSGRSVDASAATLDDSVRRVNAELDDLNVARVPSVRPKSAQPVIDFPPMADVKKPGSGSPPANVDWNGIQIGNFINEGEFVAVYKLKSRPGKVAKVPRDKGRDVARMLKEMEEGDKLLGDIEHLPTEYRKTANGKGYMVQDDIEAKGYRRFDSDDARDPAVFTRKHQEAVVELYRKLADKGLIWEDGHLGNIYFREVDGKIVAGIMDTDRIVKFDDWSMRWQEHRELVERGAWLKAIRIRSLREAELPAGAKVYPDAEFFMEKMFEYRGRFVEYDGATNSFGRIAIDPDLIQKHFPNFKKNVNYDFHRKAPRKEQPPAEIPEPTPGGDTGACLWVSSLERAA